MIFVFILWLLYNITVNDSHMFFIPQYHVYLF